MEQLGATELWEGSSLAPAPPPPPPVWQLLHAPLLGLFNPAVPSSWGSGLCQPEAGLLCCWAVSLIGGAGSLGLLGLQPVLLIF